MESLQVRAEIFICNTPKIVELKEFFTRYTSAAFEAIFFSLLTMFLLFLKLNKELDLKLRHCKD
jgi:hypothetical protein